MIYVISFTTVLGLRSCLLVKDYDAVSKLMRALESAGCTDVDYDSRRVQSPQDALDSVLNMTRAEGVTTEQLLAAYEMQEVSQ